MTFQFSFTIYFETLSVTGMKDIRIKNWNQWLTVQTLFHLAQHSVAQKVYHSRYRFLKYNQSLDATNKDSKSRPFPLPMLGIIWSTTFSIPIFFFVEHLFNFLFINFGRLSVIVNKEELVLCCGSIHVLQSKLKVSLYFSNVNITSWPQLLVFVCYYLRISGNIHNFVLSIFHWKWQYQISTPVRWWFEKNIRLTKERY